MNSPWDMQKLGDLFDITSSRRVFQSEWKSEGVPFYRAREIVKLARQGFVDNELFISEEMFNDYSAKYGVPQEGDIMVTGVGTLGVCYVVQQKDRFYFKDGNIIWLKKRSDANSRFVEYAFQSDLLRKQIDDSCGATVGTYTIIRAKNTILPVPPLSEQCRIVDVIDEAFEGIAIAKANAEKNLQNARALFESRLRSVLTAHGAGWAKESLQSLVDSGAVQLTRGRVISKQDLAATPGEFPVYSSAKENNGQFGKYGLFMFDEELITWSVDGGGRVFHRGKHKFSVTNVGGILRIRRLDRLSYEYLFRVLSYLHSQVKFDWVRKAHPSVIVKLYDDIPIPSLDTQERVAKSLRRIEHETQHLEAVYERKLAALEELRRSLLHQAFTGQLGS